MRVTTINRRLLAGVSLPLLLVLAAPMGAKAATAAADVSAEEAPEGMPRAAGMGGVYANRGVKEILGQGV